MRYTLLLALAATFAFAPTLTAQEAPEADARNELRTLVTEADGADDRAALLEVLDREDVRAVAEERGVDMDRVKDGVRTMEIGDVSRIADRFLDSDGQLAGGDTLVISATTVIIILLLLILISV
ncbi:MAG: DUF6627 family protein [Candidatus Longimicrobiales bacterium M2_2A_002]